MARSKWLKGIASNYARLFRSRNNDYLGYYGPGQLLAHFVTTSTSYARIDLYEPSESSGIMTDNMPGYATRACEWFWGSNELNSPNAITAASITIKLHPTASRPSAWPPKISRRLDCQLRISGRRAGGRPDRQIAHDFDIWCFPHDETILRRRLS